MLGVLALVVRGGEPSPESGPFYVDGLRTGIELPGVVVAPTQPATQRPRPVETPVSPSPGIYRTPLEAEMAALSPSDKDLFDHYPHAEDQDRLGEGTWIVAAPMTVEQARTRLLGPNPRKGTAADLDAMNGDTSGYTFLQVGDGVVAWESYGFADPPRRLLAELSRDGAVSAVATQNDGDMVRFGYARDGETVFDVPEYALVDNLNEIPAEVRDLAALAWEDLEGPTAETAAYFDVAMSMCEKVTGVRATNAVEDVSDWYVVPMPWGAVEDG